MLYRTTFQDKIDHVLNGYNATFFAYGMTGAGKTYTIFGSGAKGRK